MIFLIEYINVNKGVFYLIVSYLRIKGYNVLNYNNCSTDWSFPLNEFVVHVNSAPSMTLSLVYANTDLYDVVILPINTALLTTLWVILIQTL